MTILRLLADTPEGTLMANGLLVARSESGIAGWSAFLRATTCDCAYVA